MSGLHGATVDAVYSEAGFGATVPRGARPGLVVVDLSRGFTDDRFSTGTDLTDVVVATAELLSAARDAGVPRFFTTIAYSPAELAGESIAWLRKAPGMRSLTEGSDASGLDPRLHVQADELVLVKKGPSAFSGTPLASMLAAAHCDSVIVCGATTSGCVRATAVDAVQAGFDTLVVQECVGDRATGPHDAALFDLQAKYADVIGLAEARNVISAVTSQEAPA